MSTVAIILIAIGVVIALALIYVAGRRRHERRLDERRGVAAEHRSEAADRRIQADREAAIADERAAAARRQAAEAEARAQAAQEARSRASAHDEYAREVDPDADRGHDEATAATDGDLAPDEGSRGSVRR